MKKASKKSSALSAKRSVSAPSELFDAADRRAEERRMSNFSEYVRDLMRRDTEAGLLVPNNSKDRMAA